GISMVVLKSLHPPSEGVRLQQADTTAVLDGKRLGSGTLHLSWFDGSGMGFCLEYPSISLHAISRDLSAFPEEHLYVMVNAKLDGEASSSPSDDEESDSDSEDSGTLTEIRFVPSDKAALEPMFSAMCDCQALHPDPEDADTDDDDYEGEEYDVEEAGDNTGFGQEVMKADTVRTHTLQEIIDRKNVNSLIIYTFVSFQTCVILIRIMTIAAVVRIRVEAPA
uniref:Chloride channel, nucleotide-sensitive, 1A n=1 Tax=Sinocyclocheilus grahami TaxID=75366 RepID=A0A672PQJ8_SINGR